MAKSLFLNNQDRWRVLYSLFFNAKMSGELSLQLTLQFPNGQDKWRVKLTANSPFLNSQDKIRRVN